MKAALLRPASSGAAHLNTYVNSDGSGGQQQNEGGGGNKGVGGRGHDGRGHLAGGRTAKELQVRGQGHQVHNSQQRVVLNTDSQARGSKQGRGKGNFNMGPSNNRSGVPGKGRGKGNISKGRQNGRTAANPSNRGNAMASNAHVVPGTGTSTVNGNKGRNLTQTGKSNSRTKKENMVPRGVLKKEDTQPPAKWTKPPNVVPQNESMFNSSLASSVEAGPLLGGGSLGPMVMGPSVVPSESAASSSHNLVDGSKSIGSIGPSKKNSASPSPAFTSTPPESTPPLLSTFSPTLGPAPVPFGVQSELSPLVGMNWMGSLAQQSPAPENGGSSTQPPWMGGLGQPAPPLSSSRNVFEHGGFFEQSRPPQSLSQSNMFATEGALGGDGFFELNQSHPRQQAMPTSQGREVIFDQNGDASTSSSFFTRRATTPPNNPRVYDEAIGSSALRSPQSNLGSSALRSPQGEGQDIFKDMEPPTSLPAFFAPMPQQPHHISHPGETNGVLNDRDGRPLSSSFFSTSPNSASGSALLTTLDLLQELEPPQHETKNEIPPQGDLSNELEGEGNNENSVDLQQQKREDEERDRQVALELQAEMERDRQRAEKLAREKQERKEKLEIARQKKAKREAELREKERLQKERQKREAERAEKERRAEAKQALERERLAEQRRQEALEKKKKREAARDAERRRRLRRFVTLFEQGVNHGICVCAVKIWWSKVKFVREREARLRTMLQRILDRERLRPLLSSFSLWVAFSDRKKQIEKAQQAQEEARVRKEQALAKKEAKAKKQELLLEKIRAEEDARRDFWAKDRASEDDQVYLLVEFAVAEFVRKASRTRPKTVSIDTVKNDDSAMERLYETCGKVYREMFPSSTEKPVTVVAVGKPLHNRVGTIQFWDSGKKKYHVALDTKKKKGGEPVFLKPEILELRKEAMGKGKDKKAKGKQQRDKQKKREEKNKQMPTILRIKTFFKDLDLDMTVCIQDLTELNEVPLADVGMRLRLIMARRDTEERHQAEAKERMKAMEEREREKRRAKREEAEQRYRDVREAEERRYQEFMRDRDRYRPPGASNNSGNGSSGGCNCPECKYERFFSGFGCRRGSSGIPPPFFFFEDFFDGDDDYDDHYDEEQHYASSAHHEMSRQRQLDLLGATENMTVDELKKAYREQALKFHPDKYTTPEAADGLTKEQATDRFKAVTAAWNSLRSSR